MVLFYEFFGVISNTLTIAQNASLTIDNRFAIRNSFLRLVWLSEFYVLIFLQGFDVCWGYGNGRHFNIELPIFIRKLIKVLCQVS